MPERPTVLSCPIDPLSMDETVERCVSFIENDVGAQHVVVNASKLVAMQSDIDLARIVRSCALVNADGQSVVWAARLLGTPLPGRVAGVDLMHRIVARSAEEGYGVFILGARAEVLERAADNLKAAHPRLRIVGTHHGWFDDNQSEAVASVIRESGARVLFVAMSSPRKEQWLAQHLAATGVAFAMGVGGAIDVVAGVTRRAPAWMQRAGLEWFFRLVQEPRRLAGRYLRTNTRFVLLVVREIVRLKMRGRHES